MMEPLMITNADNNKIYISIYYKNIAWQCVIYLRYADKAPISFIALFKKTTVIFGKNEAWILSWWE